jgi:ABC-type sugar transport system ATPase subunit
MKAELYRTDAKAHTSGDAVLEVNNLCLEGRFDNVSFELRRGEIVGIGGIIGCGNEQLALSLFGALKPSAGSVKLNGKAVSFSQPTAAIQNGVGYLPGDRDRDGLILGLAIEKNISLASLPWMSRLGFMSNRQEERVTSKFMKDLRIVARSGKEAPLRLSGGNRQKVVLSKWLVKDKEVLILHNPTRGVDVRGKAEIHALINELAARGIGILLISDELPELIGMSDTILIMRRGQITARVSRTQKPSEEQLINYML